VIGNTAIVCAWLPAESTEDVPAMSKNISVVFSIVSGVLLVALIILAITARQPLLIIATVIVLGLFVHSLVTIRRHWRNS
jgi:hypothetical protein